MPSRTPSTSRRVIAGAAVGLALALSAPLAASAHVELDASSTAPASLSVLTFAVGHGCEGSATTSLAIRFPADVQAVKPTLAPGWSVAEQESADGTTVTYTADTPLPDSLRATVQVEALLPVDGAAGDVVAFPTLQTCVAGSTDWAETPAAGTEPDHPAPAITLTDAATTTGSGATASGTGSATGAEAAVATAAPADPVARLLGLGALVVGVVAVMLLTIGMRRPQQGGRR
ncbi:YcnI family protein [Clavibacter sepedonicus]|uniref:Sortase-sorted surface protein n=1 Tax=Clavibacter sepedonicus TaxID=31964 RepID=B0RF07_CLASE|nr:YcnI family protein [Clavibacter sepedonicus]OQJ49300.1 sortase [Clavibacter sepedonicus]OQJ54915.1 sortase [Clavibacter sepedonicus]UUK64855.1 YcnI family protein [Clavibacter sepedonicus]CAQ00940.1 putative sortase-sorted surface protein [Clavibacter sepedonicus]